MKAELTRGDIGGGEGLILFIIGLVAFFLRFL